MLQLPLAFAATGLLIFTPQGIVAQTLTDVPGTVISHIPYDSGNEQFVGSPSITILSNGDYIAAHDLFGSGTNEDQTKIVRSTDQGASWTEQTTISGSFWSTVFEHNGSLYLWGIKEGTVDKDIVIRRSTDFGATWTSPMDQNSGLLKEGTYGSTPNVPVIHSGRIFIGAGRRVMSAAVNADLLRASSWRLSDEASSAGHPFGAEFEFFSEGQVVGSPQLGVHMLAKVKDLPYAAKIDVVESTGLINFDASAEYAFPSMPGGEKKFGAQYDDVTGMYYVLSNPVLAAHEGALEDRPTLIRNTAAILSSEDLNHWDVEKLFLYGSVPEEQAFQYLNFEIDGNDLAVVSRTAFEDGLGGAKNNHDANLLTFHRIDDFRNAKPQHVLVADSGSDRVLRYEITAGNEWAPLGSFTQGTTFDGQALSNPVGIAQSPGGDVFIADKTSTTGRVLRFDSSGNFLETTAVQGIDFTGDPEGLAVGPDGQVYLSVAFGDDSDKIYRIDPDLGSVSTFVDTSFAMGQSLSNPRGLGFAPNGDLYVADRNSDAIRRFRGDDGAYLGDILSPRQPQALAWDDKNNQFVFSQRTTSTDTDILTIDASGALSQVVYTDTDIGLALGAVAVEGEIFWTDFTNDLIYQAQPGQTKRVVVGSGLNNPTYLAALENVGLEAGESTWSQIGSGKWDDPANWYYWGRADTSDELAIFGSAAGAPATVTVGGSFSVRGLRFRNPASYTIAGTGKLTLASSQGLATVEVCVGSHVLDVELLLAEDTRVVVDLVAALAVQSALDLNGKLLQIAGTGSISVSGDLKLDGGRIAIDQASQLTFAPGINPVLDGELELLVDEPQLLVAGNTFTILAGTAWLGGNMFSDVVLPPLPSGLFWDLTDLYSAGTVAVETAPPGDFDSDGDVDATDLTYWQSNFGLASGATRVEGDADEDGDVDAYDYLIWQRSFTGSTAPLSPPAAAALPEPSALALLVVLIACVQFQGRTTCLTSRREKGRLGGWSNQAR